MASLNIISAGIPPKASFLGIPTEIRLEIYNHLARHIPIHASWSWEREQGAQHRTTQHIRKICNTPNAKFPQLCAQPSWSSQSPTRNLCASRAKTQSPSLFAIRFTCKQIYAETTDIFDRTALKTSTTLSFHGVRLGFQYRLIGVQIEHLTSLTIVLARRDMVSQYETQMGLNVLVLRRKHTLLTGLRTLAVQALEPQKRFFVVDEPEGLNVFDPKRTWRKLSYVDELYYLFLGRVTVVLEAWVLLRAGELCNQSEHDEMCVVLGVVWAEAEKGVHGEESFEMKRERVVVDAKDAEWKLYWRTSRLRDAKGEW